MRSATTALQQCLIGVAEEGARGPGDFLQQEGGQFLHPKGRPAESCTPPGVPLLRASWSAQPSEPFS